MRAAGQTRKMATDATKKISEVYTHGHHKSVVSQHAKRTVENSAKYLLDAQVLDRNKTKLLDVGCGPGSITVGFAQRCKTVVGIDAVNGVLDSARAAAEKEHVSNLTLQVADVYQLPFEDECFDVVHAHQVLQHLVDPVSALREMCRVTKSGGYIAVREADYRSMLEYPPTHEIALWRRIYRETCRLNKAQPDAGSYLMKWFLDAGVPESAVEMSMSVVPYLTEEQCNDWGNAWKERALKSDFARQAVEYGAATKEQLEDISKAWEAWTKIPGRTFYYVNGEAIAQKP